MAGARLDDWHWQRQRRRKRSHLRTTYSSTSTFLYAQLLNLTQTNNCRAFNIVKGWWKWHPFWLSISSFGSFHCPRRRQHHRVSPGIVRNASLSSCWWANSRHCPMCSTNTHVPTPYWAAVSPVLVPHTTCNEAADLLVKLFGPEELKYIVGGERWWQVRGLSGIESEWITELEFLDPKIPVPKTGERKYTATESNILRMEKLESVMVSDYCYLEWITLTRHKYSCTFTGVDTHGVQ